MNKLLFRTVQLSLAVSLIFSCNKKKDDPAPATTTETPVNQQPGTQTPANTFNPSKWTVLDNKNYAPLGTYPDVFDAKMDSKNNIWLATRNGLYKFDGKNWTTFNTSNSDLPSNWVQSLEIVDTNEIYIGTRSSPNPGLAKFDGKKIVKIQNVGSTDNPTEIYGMKMVPGRKLYIGGDYYSFVYDPATNVLSKIPYQMSYVHSFEYANGVIWAGSSGYGLYKFDGTNGVQYSKEKGNFPANYAASIRLDKKGVLWMGSYAPDIKEQIGLIKFDGTTSTIYNTTNSKIPSLQVEDLDIDADGNFWFGSGDGNAPKGVVEFDGTNFTVYNTSNTNSGLPTNSIESVVYDQRTKQLLIGTYSYGLAIFK